MPDYSIPQSIVMNHSQLSRRLSLRPISAFLNQSALSPGSSIPPVTPNEGTPKPRLINVRQQVAAASTQPASSQAPEFEQIQVG